MAKGTKSTSSEPVRPIRPALNPESRQNQMISMAENLAEKWLQDGTAPAQVVTHYLKLGTMRERLELERLKGEIKLQEAKTKALGDVEEIKVMYANALKAMRTYDE